jgi:hypothetical protein
LNRSDAATWTAEQVFSRRAMCAGQLTSEFGLLDLVIARTLVEAFAKRLGNRLPD